VNEAVAGGDDLARALGHPFAQPALLTEALTHASALARAPGRGKSGGKSNRAAPKLRGYERLEFLGDRVLGLVVAELLWRRFPDEAEGPLTRRHAQLVRRETLTEVARAIDLDRHVIVSSGEQAAGTAEGGGILADVCEAIIAALYVDGGLPAASRFIERHWAARIEAASSPPRDPKTALQEWAQGRGLALPLYETIEIAGPPHQRHFTVRVTVTTLSPETATGASKRAAEIAAAAALLATITPEGST
jgi:ribonuclease-3